MKELIDLLTTQLKVDERQAQGGPLDVETQPFAQPALARGLGVEQQQAAIGGTQHAFDASDEASTAAEIEVDRLGLTLQRPGGEHLARDGQYRFDLLHHGGVCDLAGHARGEFARVLEPGRQFR